MSSNIQGLISSAQLHYRLPTSYSRTPKKDQSLLVLVYLLVWSGMASKSEPESAFAARGAVLWMPDLNLA
jgi:hypothetical protein